MTFDKIIALAALGESELQEFKATAETCCEVAKPCAA